MQQITLKVTSNPSIRFKGEKIGFACTTDQREAGRLYSQEVGRWEELSLYKTDSGKFICYLTMKTRWEDEQNNYLYKVCTTHQEVIDYFGQEEVANDLYQDAKIENIEDIA